MYFCTWKRRGAKKCHLQLTDLKLFKRIINGVIWVLLGTYLLVITLLHVPAIQGYIGGQVSDALQHKFGTKVTVGRVDLGFLNRLIIDDVLIYDQKDKKMIKVARLTGKAEIAPLFHGQIIITSAQLFGAHCAFYQNTEQSKPNYQFMLDSLASKDTTKSAPLNLRINSFIMRHGSVAFDRNYIAPTPNRLQPAHLHMEDISAEILLPHLTNDSINLAVEKLSFKEQSGLNLQDLSFRFDGSKKGCRLSDFSLKMPGTDIEIPQISARYQMQGDSIIPASIAFNGRISKSDVTLYDIACLLPSLKSFHSKLSMATSFEGTHDHIRIYSLNVSSTTGDITISANGRVNNLHRYPTWYANISNFRLSANAINFISENLKGQRIQVPAVVSRLGNIHIKGIVNGRGVKDIITHTQISTGIGNVKLAAKLQNSKDFNADVNTSGLNLNTLLNDKRFGLISTHIYLKGNLRKSSLENLTANGIISLLDFNNYQYHNIDIDGRYTPNHVGGRLSIADPHINLDIKGIINNSGRAKDVNLEASIRQFSPKALNITNQWKDAVFDANINANFKATSFNDAKGLLAVHHFQMKSSSKQYQLDNLNVESGYINSQHYLKMTSDFGYARLMGEFQYGTLLKSFTNLVGSRLPTLPGWPAFNYQAHNNFAIVANIEKTDWLEAFLNVPLQIKQPITLVGTVDDAHRNIDLSCSIPSFSYKGINYKNGNVDISSPDDTLHCHASLSKCMQDGTLFDATVKADAINNHLVTALSWDNNGKRRMKGRLNAIAQFFKNEQGQQAAEIKVQPSNLNIDNSEWKLAPSEITYSAKQLTVDNFTVQHDDQYLRVNGKASTSQQDSLTIDLQDIDVAYILKLVNFDAVTFDGKASGKAYISTPFTDMSARAKLMVNHFEFQDGRMGVLDANVNWNKKDKQIDIKAIADDGPDAITYINGYVSPERNLIDLGIRAAGTHIDFMQSFTSSFMNQVEGHANGDVRLAGPLNNINLTGELVVNGDANITQLNCRYWLRNDTIRLEPDEIHLNKLPVYDMYDNQGLLSGGIHHKHLTNLSYDLDIEAKNLLSYDFHDFGSNTFYGTVFASGKVDIHGKSGELDINVNATPQQGSFFVYNVSSSDAVTNHQYITWHDATPVLQDSTFSLTPVKGKEEKKNEIAANTHINFLVNCTPTATLKLLMDSKTNDYINLHGNGVIRATYYNKGAFNMFGTYTVNDGTYDITIQEIIKKHFNFNQGGTIVFGGDPYQAALNLQAMYTVNGVSLSDLNIGNSFTSNTTRVNCLMNIGGQPAAPNVTFDLDMPNVNADEKQMIRSVINSEDEMNQQVLYLLGIGRFYPQTANNATSQTDRQNQTSLAMKSLLSGTLSSQINSVLKNVIKSNNWNFGANISTGDEGWSNAEYEGLLSGRLLNNRLLINGQFGYRDNAKTASTSFIGDFDMRYLLYPNGNLAIKVYNQTNDRYFTKSSLNTQGIGLIMKKDFNGLRDLFHTKKTKNKKNKATKR